MSWHPIPRDDAWKRVTLGHIASLGQRLHIRCHCARERYVDALAYAAEARLSADTPLLAISRRLRCSSCGERHVSAQPEPYGIPGKPRP